MEQCFCTVFFLHTQFSGLFFHREILRIPDYIFFLSCITSDLQMSKRSNNERPKNLHIFFYVARTYWLAMRVYSKENQNILENI